MKTVLTLASMLSVSTFGTFALAQSPGTAAPSVPFAEGGAVEAEASAEAPIASSEPRLFHLRLDGAVGGSSLGAHASALGLVRVGMFELGPTVSYSGALSDRIGGGLVAGLGVHHGEHLGFDVLGEAGMNSQHTAGSLLSSDPGASGAIPYAGLRMGGSWRFGAPTNRTRGYIGIWTFARQDLESRVASYTYERSSLFSNGRSTELGRARLGGELELGLSLAGGFDIGL